MLYSRVGENLTSRVNRGKQGKVLDSAGRLLLTCSHFHYRQMRKVDGGLRALNVMVEQSPNGHWLIGDKLTLADLAAGSVLGYMAVRWTDHPWRQEYPALERYWQGLDARESFANTRPSPQTMKDKIV